MTTLPKEHSEISINLIRIALCLMAGGCIVIALHAALVLDSVIDAALAMGAAVLLFRAAQTIADLWRLRTLLVFVIGQMLDTGKARWSEFSCEYISADAYPKGDYVYVMRDEGLTGLFKIGRTNHPAERQKGLSNTLLPFEYNLKVVHVMPCHQMKSTRAETILHERYAGKRVRGEYFNLSAADVAEIKQISDF